VLRDENLSDAAAPEPQDAADSTPEQSDDPPQEPPAVQMPVWGPPVTELPALPPDELPENGNQDRDSVAAGNAFADHPLGQVASLSEAQVNAVHSQEVAEAGQDKKEESIDN